MINAIVPPLTPGTTFAHIFQKAKSAGLGITIHAGEPSVPEAPGNIITAIEKLGADRIGHGVQAIHDPRVIDSLVRKEIPLELCPTSNVLTKAVNSIEDHPIKRLMELGVKTTINSDDPGVMGISLMTEYNLAFNGLKMSLEQLEKCNLWAADSSFICTEKKARHQGHESAIENNRTGMQHDAFRRHAKRSRHMRTVIRPHQVTVHDAFG